MSEELQKGNSILRPRARLIKTIGEELISNDIVAVLELVKNSYDADASIIEINFAGKVEDVEISGKKKKVLRKEGASIHIFDDGTGMSLDTIKQAWMEPATVMKKATQKSPLKARRYTGEKGIGRFASAKLSSSLEIFTRVAKSNEVYVHFDWAAFSKEEKYLDEVTTDWEVRLPEAIKEHGTLLKLNNLNSDWDDEKIDSLRIALSRLVNPVAPAEDFLIELNVPGEFGDFSGLISAPDAINKPDYSIKGTVDGRGIASISYIGKKEKKETAITKDLSKIINPQRQPESGPFTFEFRVWDREKESLDALAKEVGSTIRNVRADLDEVVGISIYRDNFRVLPYGEPKNDWLRLNARRVNNPTLRLSVNQVVGYISIGLDTNKGLTDQSNREGIVESQAFTDLQDQVLALLNELELKRYEQRPRKEDPSDVGAGLYQSFNLSSITDIVSKKHPDDKEVLEIVQAAQVKIDQGVKKVQEVLSRYRRLSTLGLLIDSVLHDGGHFLLNIDSEVRLLEKELGKKEPDNNKVKGYLGSIQEQRGILAQLFRRLEPFGGRKRGRPSKVVIEEAIKDVFGLSRLELERLGIETSLPESENAVTIDNGELQMILINLLQNSIYWLSTIEGERKIEVEVERTENELSIIFSDSGPGISEDQSKYIFDPYYTTRPDGVGLGLTIVGELVAEYNGDFYLINNGPLDGATFKIIFRKRI